MKCPNCGREISDDSIFCEFCGEKVSAIENNANKKAKWLPFFIVGLCVVVGIIIAASIASNTGMVSNESNYYVEETQAETGASMQTSEYVDLGLPSGTLWKTQNEGAYYLYSQAKEAFGLQLPSINQWQELHEYCSKSWEGNGWLFYGPNGYSLFLPAEGYISHGDDHIIQNGFGYYWAYDCFQSTNGWYLYFDDARINVYDHQGDDYQSVRLVKSN